jgi:membrane dipeptidase
MAPDAVCALYESSIVVDCLNGSALTSNVIAHLRASGLTAMNLTAVQIGHDFAAALDDLRQVDSIVAANPDVFLIAREAADIRLAKATGRIAILLGMQDAAPIGRDLDRLHALADLGVRVIQLTHNRRNELGTGCVEQDEGLSPFGRDVVAEMNRLGIVIDLSHSGPKTTLDAIEASAAPVACTHSNPQSVAWSLRNKTDDTIRRLAERQGLIGIAAWSPIVYRGNGRRPVLEDVLDCFSHAIDLVGPQAVAIGTDICEDAMPTREAWTAVYGPQGAFPQVTGGLGDWYGFDTVNAEGLDTIEGLPALALGLARRVNDPGALRDILGQNVLRLFERVRAAALR